MYGRSQGELDFTVSALYLDMRHRNVQDNEVSCILACRQMLIESGCDPTLPVLCKYDPGENIDRGSILFRDFDGGIQESIKIILNSPFINVETILHQDNETPLLALCDGDVSARWKLEGISVLIDRGANILARNSHGRNCLHLVLECVNLIVDSPFELEAYRRLYEYLLQNGADPHAIDDEKRSVSDVAYNPEYALGVNSLVGDLWDAALAGSGFCVAQFRQGRARRAHYGFHRRAKIRYTRLEFEKLWLGREQLCPYYYDEEPQVIEVDSDTERGAGSDYSDSLDSGSWVVEEESDLDMGTDSEDYNSSDSEDGGGRL